MPLTLTETFIKGLYICDSTPIEDERGSFTRLFCKEALSEVLSDKHIIQINQSVNKHKGTVRGMHYQKPPYAEMKIVRCLTGRIFDVVVDIRKDSPTFLKWFGLELTPKNNKSLIIPEGFAHGFQVLENDSQVLYLHTERYDKQSEGALNILDPKVSIDWPLILQNVSERDQSHPFLDDNFLGVVL